MREYTALVERLSSGLHAMQASVQQARRQQKNWTQSRARNGTLSGTVGGGGLLSMPEAGSPLARWPIFIFLVCAFLCLSGSAVYHLFYCHSEHVADALIALDYAGISLLIGGSFIPLIYYQFYCTYWTSVTYLSVSTAASLCTFTFCFTPNPFLRTFGLAKAPVRPAHKRSDSVDGLDTLAETTPKRRSSRKEGGGCDHSHGSPRPTHVSPAEFAIAEAKWRKFKVKSYVASGAVSIAPWAHLNINGLFYGVEWHQPTNVFLLVVGMTYLLGAILYIIRFPERQFPGGFDIFLSRYSWVKGF